jgi:beta-phosphoglucomutase family hydrolase
MDGVIVDSNPIHRIAWAAFNRTYGLETTEEMHQRMYGRRNDQIVRDFFGDELSAAEVETRGAAKEAMYREMMADRWRETLVPGLLEFLEEHREVPKALATNAETENVDFLLDRSGLRKHFLAVVDGRQVQHPKPDPEIYLKAADLIGVSPDKCIVFEDSHAGVEAGIAAGMRVVGLRTTYDYLPGTSIAVHNFLSDKLRSWLAEECQEG